jgi:hypothetical protein
MRQQQMANIINNNGPLRLCFFDHGIDPDAISSCIKTAPDEATARSCVTDLVGSDEQRMAAKRCVLEEQARQTVTTHTTNCYNTLFGGVSCTSN